MSLPGWIYIDLISLMTYGSFAHNRFRFRKVPLQKHLAGIQTCRYIPLISRVQGPYGKLWTEFLSLLLGHPNKLFRFPSPDRPTFFQSTI